MSAPGRPKREYRSAKHEGSPVRSIAAKLLAFTILATLIPAIGLGALSFWRYQRLINDNVADDLRTFADTAARELTLWQRERAGDLRTLSTSNTVVDGMSAVANARTGTPKMGSIDLELYLRSVQKRLAPLVELTLTDTKGRVIASSATAPAPVKVPDPWPANAATEGVVLGLPHWDTERATPTVTVLLPVLSLRNELLGALSVVLDLGSVAPQIKGIVRSPLVEVILFNTDGAPLSATRTATAELTPLSPRTLQQLRAHGGMPVVYPGHRQRDVLGLADAPRALPIVVVAEADRAAVYQAWLDTLKLYVALVLALMVVVAAVAYALARSVVRPLNRLTRAASHVADGDLSGHLPVTQKDEIGSLTRVFNRMTEQLRRGQAELEMANDSLREQNHLLEALSVTDALTGLYNRNKLDTVLVDQYARFRRNRRPFCVLMLDIDNFKSINDTYGHATGDDVLVNLAKVLVQSVRGIDSVARYGGEEFVVVLIETGADAALEVAERVRLLVQTPRYGEAAGQLISVTASIGVACCRDEDTGPDDILARADRALYDAKHAGRNNVQLAI
jgi:diguanylate cyclase (GGDEF)-like protein